MALQLKPVSEQVIVITGASSGIGLVTAEIAAEAGAKLVLAARSGQTLNTVAKRLTRGKGEAIAVVCDVSDRAQVAKLAEAAIKKFGRIDTWVNNAGLGMYGPIDICDDDARKLFDINFWGVVHGSLAALPHLKKQGGALINVGSEVSDGYAPLMGMYTATKHAVKGFTDVLRVEIEDVEKAPVSVTLIQPTAVNTPFPQHARNYMDQEPKLPDPMIEPKDVASAILYAAANPMRQTRVGTMSKLNIMMAQMFPSMTDRLAAGKVDQLTYDEKPRYPLGALHEASETNRMAGHTHGTGGKSKG